MDKDAKHSFVKDLTKVRNHIEHAIVKGEDLYGCERMVRCENCLAYIRGEYGCQFCMFDDLYKILKAIPKMIKEVSNDSTSMETLDTVEQKSL